MGQQSSKACHSLASPEESLLNMKYLIMKEKLFAWNAQSDIVEPLYKSF